MKPMRIYVAGKYNDSDVFKVFDNIKLGMKASVDVMEKMGHHPFCPWMDYHYMLMGNGNITHKMLYEASLSWLKVSDAILMLSGWEESKGARAEWELAKEMGIPIYYNLNDIPKVEQSGKTIGHICDKGCVDDGDVIKSDITLIACKHGMFKGGGHILYNSKVNK